MRTEQPTKCLYHFRNYGLGCARIICLSPQEFITDRSNAVVLLWFSVACFWCQSFDDFSSYVCSFYFYTVWVAEWSPFWEILAHSVYRMFSLYFYYL